VTVQEAGACSRAVRGEVVDEAAVDEAAVDEAAVDEVAVDVVVVGAGVAGMYMVYRLRGLGLSVQGFEAGSDVGGTWYWNRYPGARCDVQSVDYSYSFSDELQQEWTWTERYAQQAEILGYLNHVADRFELRPHFDFDTRVTEAHLDETSMRWLVRTDKGQQVRARFCIFATGSLSNATVPDIPGLADFTGDWYHTGQWPHEGVDLSGRRIGVIGTGSSGIQSVPVLAESAAHLFVFQRSANFSVPARNRPMTDAEQAEIKATYDERRRKSRASGGGSIHEPYPLPVVEVPQEQRQAIYEAGWELGGVIFAKTFPDQLTTLDANDTARAFVEEKIRAIVTDPAVADLLVPTDHPIGTKRICTDSNYFETFNRPNVSLIDLRSTPIEAITADGIRTTNATFELDTIVFATGFDAMTGSLLRIDIRGRGGQTVRDVWAGGPRTYLGLSIAGFPNLFVMTGPGSPSVLANMILAAEHHADWIAECIDYIDAHDLVAIEATEKAQDEWVAYGNELASQTLFPATNSWYVGANIPGKPRTFMPFIGGLGTYRKICADIADRGYEGFEILAG
jgi:cation diffusion facilitator CzcD-associated flavoprotein CzcO